jgi:predicted nuclease of predicted toxin-antitoxin system
MDEHVPSAVTQGLRRRGVDVLTAQEAAMVTASDEEHLAFALSQGRVIFTQDADFLRLHVAGSNHAGIAYVHQQTPVGDMIRGLMLIVEVLEPGDMLDHVEYL